MPITCDGMKLATGKKKPVTLVKTVVARNSAVQPSSFLAPSMPNRTTSPENYTDQAQGDVHLRESVRRHPQDHDTLLS
jgi:hypothetical protein